MGDATSERSGAWASSGLAGAAGFARAREDCVTAVSTAYLDTAAVGLVPRSVQEQATALQRRMLSAGTTTAEESGRFSVARLDARRAACRLLGCDEGSVAITSSAMTALDTVFSRLSKETGNVVTFADEYPPLVQRCKGYCDQQGNELRLVEAGAGERRSTALGQCIDEDTRVIVVSHVHFATAAQLDLVRLREMADAVDALVFLDATQSLGASHLSMSDLGADLVIASGYKWLCGTFGAAIAATSTKLLDACSVGGRRLCSAPELFEFSTMGFLSAGCLGASISYLMQFEEGEIERHSACLAQQLRNGVMELGGKPAAAVEDSAAHIVSAQFPGHSSEGLAKALRAHAVYVAERMGFLRFGVHWYTDRQDVDRALQVLADALEVRA
jgi:cysteine desulfurase / selenocysteine lyase